MALRPEALARRRPLSVIRPFSRSSLNRGRVVKGVSCSWIWAEFLIEFAGQPLIARFDPQHVKAGAHVYRMNNAYLGFAECLEAVGFNDTNAAREQERKTRRLAKLTKEAAALEVTMKPDDVVRALGSLRPVEPEPPAETGNVVRAAFDLPRAAEPEREREGDAEIFRADFLNGVAKLVAQK